MEYNTAFLNDDGVWNIQKIQEGNSPFKKCQVYRLLGLKLLKDTANINISSIFRILLQEIGALKEGRSAVYFTNHGQITLSDGKEFIANIKLDGIHFKDGNDSALIANSMIFIVKDNTKKRRSLQGPIMKKVMKYAAT